MAKKKAATPKQNQRPSRVDWHNHRGGYPTLDGAKEAFLTAFRQTGTMMSACQSTGLNRRSVYAWIKDDLEFSENWALANRDLMDRLEMAAIHRGVNGVEKYVLHNGRPVPNPARPGEFLTVREFSDHCLEMLMSARDPRYSRRNQTEVKVDVRIVNEISAEVVAVVNRNVPDACPHCKTLLAIKPAIARDMEHLSEKFNVAAA